MNNAGECIVYILDDAYLRTSNDEYTPLPQLLNADGPDEGYTALNNSGEAAGTIQFFGFVLNLSNQTFEQFRVAPAIGTTVTSLNDAGDTLGYYRSALGPDFGFVRSANRVRVDSFLPPINNRQDQAPIGFTSGLNNAGELAGSINDAKPYIASPTSDDTPPSTTLISIVNGPPKRATFSVVDSQSGLFLLSPLSTNAKVVVGPIALGQTTPVIVAATKIDQTQKATIQIQESDMAGNYTLFDPQLVTVSGDPGAAPQLFRDIPAREHVVVVANGKLGLESLHITVNGKLLSFRLKDCQKKTINLRQEMTAGRNNMITFSGEGPTGSDAFVVLMQPSGK